MNSSVILQVDDDENDVLLLEYALKAAHITTVVRSAKDGGQAIDYLAGTGEFADRVRFPFPQLVLSDLKMPRVGGLEMLKWIRGQASFRSLPVVMFTASASQHEVDEAYALGANSFIIKPAGVHELSDLVKVITAYWLRYNRNANIAASR